MQNAPETERQKIARDIAAQFAEIATVETVALGGSLAAGRADARSDIDPYVFYKEPMALEARARIIGPCSSRMELDNGFWGGTEDYWLEKEGGVKVEAIYEGKGWSEVLNDMFIHNRARTGNSTSLWHTVAASKALFDRSGWVATLQKLAGRPYLDALADAIISKNFVLLR